MNYTNRHHILKQVSVKRHKVKGQGTPAHMKQFDDVSDMLKDMGISAQRATNTPKEQKEKKSGKQPLRFRF